MKRERGESLVEVVVAVAVVAIAGAALMAATMTAAHRFGPDPSKMALERVVQREMRVAIDLLKYRGGSIAPATVATTVPLPGASPAPAHLSIAATALPGDTTSIVLQASFDANPTVRATLTTTVAAPVPLPSSTVLTSGAAPQ